MRVTTYKTLINENFFPVMFKEGAVNYKTDNLYSPKSIVQMMNDIFKMNIQSEEYLYELCFTSKMRLIGVFEIAHGTIDHIQISPREIFQKALMCGAARVVLVHNHPSGDPVASKADICTAERLNDAGELIGVPIADHIIIGKEFISFHEKGLLACK